MFIIHFPVYYSTLCSPSGDTLMGDGISEAIVTPDWRMELPEFGLYEAQRVCLHCYFDSYRRLSKL
jgi:hypothetical protein